MILTRLCLKEFRNYEAVDLSGFSEKLNVFVGKNAQGKTNLIEGIGYLSCAKSFRGVGDGQLIREGFNAASLYAEYRDKNRNGKVEAKLFGDAQRMIKVNGLPITRVSQMLGVIGTVVFAPEDLKTVKESPQLRRRLMNVEISKIRPVYYTNLQQYNTAVKQKNKILKQKNPDEALIGAFNEAIAEHGAALISKRAAFLEGLGAAAALRHEQLTGKKETLRLRYRCSADPGDAKKSLLTKLEAMMKREIEAGISFIGPHREDFELYINDQDVRLYASQGQQRTAMIAIKLGVADFCEKASGTRPILLLDDVLSELDASRASVLLAAVCDSQVFLTVTDNISLSGSPKTFYIEEGKAFAAD